MNEHTELLELLKDLPETQEKIFKIFLTTLNSTDLRLQKLANDSKSAHRPSESSELSSVGVNSLIKTTEKNILTKLSVQNTKLNTKIESLEDTLKDFMQLSNKEINTLGAKISQMEIEKQLSSLKNETKKEIYESTVSPLEFEIKENYKSLQVIEQTIKVQNWNIETAHKEFNSRFDVHREKICKLENTVQDFLKQADDMVMKIITPIKKSVELCEITVKNLYSGFSQDIEEVMHDLRNKDEDRQKLYSEHLSSVSKLHSEIEKSIKEMLNNQSLHIQEVSLAVGQMQSQIDLFKHEMRISQRDCYSTAKSDLIKGYKLEIQGIEEKLKWLPANTQDISEMTPVEARLFTIETRIRSEEANRIQQMNQVFNEFSNLIRSKKKRMVRDQEKVIETFIRAQTPVPVSTRVCKSPGGMKILNVMSGRRIRRKAEKTISLINFAKTKIMV